MNELECGPMPNVMAALLTPATELPCSNAAKMRNPLKLAGMPQTTGPISAASGPKFTILWGIWRRYCFLTSFFRLSICALVANIQPDSCMMVHRWRIFGDFFAWKYGRHPISASLYNNFCKTGNYVIYDVIIWVQDGNCKKWL